jgi:hypothetical protein
MPNLANTTTFLSVVAALQIFSGMTLAQSSGELRALATFSSINDSAARSRALFEEAAKVITAPRCGFRRNADTDSAARRTAFR